MVASIWFSTFGHTLSQTKQVMLQSKLRALEEGTTVEWRWQTPNEISFCSVKTMVMKNLTASSGEC